jgi:hypothetical protein
MHNWPLLQVTTVHKKLKALIIRTRTFSAKLVVVVAVIVSCSSEPVRATAVYTYKKDEYPVVTHGLAPNRQVSIAAQGEGEDGADNFHVYVMSEPEHKVKAILPGIDSNDILDSAPSAYEANWSADSRYVTISYRRDRHLRVARPYYVYGKHAQLLQGPELLKASIHKTLKSLGRDTSVTSGDTSLSWLSPTRFSLSETRRFHIASPKTAHAFGEYGRVTDPDKDHASYVVEFSVDAVCELVSATKYRVVSIKPRAFHEP